MKLNVAHDFSSREMSAAWYTVFRGSDSTPQDFAETAKRLSELAPRIEKMCQTILGDDFHKIDFDGDVMRICFTFGVSSGSKKFRHRSLLGWIELCDVEENGI